MIDCPTCGGTGKVKDDAPLEERYGPRGNLAPKDCRHSSQDWYIDGNGNLRCGECEEKK